MAELAIVENVQRKDLNPIEKAASFQRYMDEYDCTQEELSARVSIDRSTVANLLRLLELPEEVKDMIVPRRPDRRPRPGAAAAGRRARAAASSLGGFRRNSMSVRATEQAVAEHIRRTDGEPLSIVDAEGQQPPVAAAAGPALRDMEEQLALSLGTKVEIKQSAKGRGRITIHFASHEEFERLRTMLAQQASVQSGAM